MDEDTNFHGSEIFYHFDTLDTRRVGRGHRRTAVAQAMAAALVAFARTGDPNRGGRPTWPRFTGPYADVMRLSAISMVASLEQRALEFLDSVFAQAGQRQRSEEVR